MTILRYRLTSLFAVLWASSRYVYFDSLAACVFYLALTHTYIQGRCGLFLHKEGICETDLPTCTLYKMCYNNVGPL